MTQSKACCVVPKQIRQQLYNSCLFQPSLVFIYGNLTFPEYHDTSLFK